MIDNIKQELLQINSQLFELEERKKQLKVYLQGYEEARKESQKIEQELQEKIDNLSKEEK